MKKSRFLITIIILLTTFLYSQKITQTIRGKVVDIDTKSPLIGAQIIIIGSNPLIGTTTDLQGNFRFDKINIGRVNLKISFVGYESKTISNIVVNSGKEVVLNINLQETTITIDELIVTAYKVRGEVTNEMSLLSGHQVTTEETERFANGLASPARIVTNFAGVTNTQDGRNDIIIRGNSPKYFQWRLEGIEITNPAHFEDQNSSSGLMSALNHNLLATSDFYTGAFSPEYGNVLSGIYDIKLRSGNNEKFEATFSLGGAGTDLTLEGPLFTECNGSYLFNYRYSTISMLKNIGIVDMDGLLNFQDAALKATIPTKGFGNFSLFALGGLSNYSLKDLERGQWETPGNRGYNPEISEDWDKENYLFNLGMNHFINITKKSLMQTALSFSSSGIEDDIFESKIIKNTDIKNDRERKLNYKSKIFKSVLRGAITYSNKLNTKNKFQIGGRYSLFSYDNYQSRLGKDLNSRNVLVDFNGTVSTLNNFVSWKHLFNNNFNIVFGIHNMNVLYNSKSTIEPRVAFEWKLNTVSTLYGGYGSHSNMERIHNYFTKIELADGSFTEPNKDLDLLKANHFVLGYKTMLSDNLMAKVEMYYQDLYNLPVENSDTSYYCTINEGLDYRYVDLVNKGVGKNYGIELTIERFFDNDYYFLINGSLYNSKYKSLEGIERNTQYNGNYIVNILFGKEFRNMGINKNQTLAINAKFFFGGGKKIIPLLRNEAGKIAVETDKNKYWDFDKAYNEKIEDIFNLVLSVSYKWNIKNITHELFLNIDNVLNSKGKISEFYDESKPNSVGYMTQFGLFPNLIYRVYF